MYKDENERMHDEDVDLTKMIHAYRQDDEPVSYTHLSYCGCIL